MLSLDAAIDRAATKIDAILTQKIDALELQLIEDGTTIEDAGDVVEQQRDVYRAWRIATLAAVRTRLLAEVAYAE